MDDFRQASDLLNELGISYQQQAAAFGKSYQMLRLWRLDPTAKGYRSPPPASNWRSTFAQLARERAAALVEVAGRME